MRGIRPDLWNFYSKFAIIYSEKALKIVPLVKTLGGPVYTIVFYEDEDGHSEVEAWIKYLDSRAKHEKSARVQLDQMFFAMERAQADGARVGRHLRGDIYELRPGDNRVLFFGWKGRHLVLLSQFRKQGQKTPPREIAKAERLMEDWIRRNGKE